MIYGTLLRLTEGNKQLARKVVSYLKRRDKLTEKEWREELSPILKEISDNIDDQIKSYDVSFWNLTNMQAIRGALTGIVTGFDEQFNVALEGGQEAGMILAVDEIEKQFIAAGLGKASIVFAIEDTLAGINPLTSAIVNNFSGDMAKIISTEVSLGLTNGDSPFVVAKKIQDKFKSSNMSFARAKTIAITEMNTASSLAQKIRGDELFVENKDLRKIWINSHKPNARVTHIAVETKTLNNPVAIDRPFIVDGIEAMYPRDPVLPAKHRVNCGCDLVYVNIDNTAEIDLVRAGAVASAENRFAS